MKYLQKGEEANRFHSKQHQEMGLFPGGPAIPVTS